MSEPPSPPADLTLGSDGYPAAGGVARRPAGAAESARANRRWWDAAAPAYLAEHGTDLGDVDFLWCPEGLREADAHLLGDVAGRRVLEIGCGSAPCARWLRERGSRRRRAGPLRRDAGAGGRAQPVDRPRRAAGPGRRGRAARRGRERRPGVLGVRRAPVRRRRRVPSSPRSPGCCGRAAGSSPRSTTRCGGRSPTPPTPRTCGSSPRTSTGRRTWRPTTTGGRSTWSTTARSATGCARSSAPA